MLQVVLDAILPEIDHLRTVLLEEFAFDEARIDRVTRRIHRYAWLGHTRPARARPWTRAISLPRFTNRGGAPPMARSTSPDIRPPIRPGSPAPSSITQWIISDIALGDEGIYVDGTAYSMTHVVNLPVGVADQADVTLEGFFDDDDDGPFDLFGTISTVNTPPYTLTSDLDGAMAGLDFGRGRGASRTTRTWAR